jgi:L-fucose isomerase and related proteins
MHITNMPTVKLGIVATSRDCFPAVLSEKRRANIAAACKKAGIEIYESKVTVENEKDAVKALDDVTANGVNALLVYLGNFGPEGPETLLAQRFLSCKKRAVMFAAAAEESKDDLINGRGDAYCGMLNASYNIGLRNLKVYIPSYPVGEADDIVCMLKDFEKIAAVKIGLAGLKIFTFGPRPFDFLACNAPIAPLFDLGVEIQENSELDLYEAFLKHDGDPRIEKVAAEMAAELGKDGNGYPAILPKLAQYEITLLDWAESNLGASTHYAFANKCWPAFQTMFHFVPCYVNSRLTARGIPVSCEVDIYGALSEYILSIVTGKAVTLLDINNTVPRDLYDSADHKNYAFTDMFMGFHCGNTASCLLKKGAAMKYQLIMKRNLEPDSEPNISRGTLEGDIAPSDITFFRLQSTADAKLRSYIAQGEVLDIPSHTFGGVGVIAIPEMARFYRHILIEKRYPHHGGVGFAHCGKILFEALNLLGVPEIDYNQPKSLPYKSENPFA